MFWSKKKETNKKKTISEELSNIKPPEELEVKKDKKKFKYYEEIKMLLEIIRDNSKEFKRHSTYEEVFIEHKRECDYKFKSELKNIKIKIGDTLISLKEKEKILYPLESKIPPSLMKLFIESCYVYSHEYMERSEEELRMDGFSKTLKKIKSISIQRR